MSRSFSRRGVLRCWRWSRGRSTVASSILGWNADAVTWIKQLVFATIHYQRISCNAEIVQVRALARDGKDPITGTFEEDFSGKLRSSKKAISAFWRNTGTISWIKNVVFRANHIVRNATDADNVIIAAFIGDGEGSISRAGENSCRCWSGFPSARDSIKRLALQFYRIEKVSFLTRLRIDLIIQAKEIIGRTFTRRGEKPITGAFECAEALDLDHIGNLNVQ